MNAPPIIQVSNLQFAYKKAKQIFNGVSFEISPGERCAITGRSGAGKSTLAYILRGVIPHSIQGNLKADALIVDGYQMPNTPLSTTARSVGMVFQDLNAQLFSSTVTEEIEFGLKNLKMDPNLALKSMKHLNIEDLAKSIPMNLSAGQKQRVILASVIAMQPKVLILDEPSVHLDALAKVNLRDWLLELNRSTNMTILLVGNEPWLIGEVCDQILVVDEGRVFRKSKSEVMERRPEWGWKI